MAVGLAGLPRADFVAVTWPDGVFQTELALESGRLHAIGETQRQLSSCPVLFVWNGTRFEFVTDVLGTGGIGFFERPGVAAAPFPRESVLLPASMQPVEGKYRLKLAEPMDEVMYIDRVRLSVVDHPPEVVVFPDERFATSDPQPTQEVLAFRARHFPKKATDHRGQDVTPQVTERDRRAVDGFARRSWLGFAEDHSVTLDFGEVPAGAGGRWDSRSTSSPTRRSWAGPRSTSRTCSCCPPSAAGAPDGRSCGRSRASRSAAAAAGWSGRSSTGTGPRSGSTAAWARHCAASGS